MIGVKSATAVGLAAIAAAIAGWRGRLAIDHLATLGPSSCFAIGLLGGLATALIAIGVRPRLASRLAIGWRDRRIVLAPVGDGATARDLPAGVQRALWTLAFACMGLAVFTNPATARLIALPDHLTEASAGEYCRAAPRPAAEPATPAPKPKPVEIPGCALVKRAVALGYAKSLGNCAPKDAPGPVKTAIAAAAPCTKRQLDEPYFHYAYRKLAGAGGAMAGANPIDAIEAGIDDKRIQIDHLDTLIAAHRHSVSGSPHASHHLFVTLPDPHPPTLIERVIDPPRCDDRYASLPLWPAPDTKDGALVDHVLGQLLFAARFGTTASCGDYTIHWGAAADTCAKLRTNPIAVLDAHDALEPVRDVLDRRRRALELAALDVQLHRKPPPPPPAANVIVSMTCVDTTAPDGPPAISGAEVAIDGEPVSVRELHVHGVDATGSGVIGLYAALASVLGGDDTAPATVDPTARPEPAPDAGELDHADFRLVRLDRLHDTDPFTGGTRWPLDRADLREVYPVARQLRTFVDGFRRRYKAQRGRL